jgi:hypothetical protein
VSNPFLEPVRAVWGRVAGILLLASATGLTAILVHEAFDRVTDAASRRTFNSSSMLYGLVLLALCGICWQAGYRLAFQKPDRSGSLFSRPAWFAIGTGLLVITMLMAGLIIQARTPTLLDVQVVLSLGGIGVWCLLLAFRRSGGSR